MKRSQAAAGLALSASLVAMAPAMASASTPKPTGKTHGVTLQFMIASSGTAETNADKAAAAAWGKATGNKVNVINSSNETEQLTEAFAGGTPPDVFYGQSSMFQSMVKNAQLFNSGNYVAPASAFYPSLNNAFTYDHQRYCVPKDSSTLALEINTDMWKAAGLGAPPKTWAQLASDAKALTKHGVTGLVLSDSLDRLGAFFAENGGSYMNGNSTKFTFNSPQNIAALKWVQSLAHSGALKFQEQVDAGWGGEAFGLGKAAMTIEGNWIIGAMQSDYPKIKYEVVPLPAGPRGKHGTLVFTNCWGIAANSKYTAADVSFVKYLASPAQQLRFAKAFGVMPSRPSVAKQWASENSKNTVASGKETPDVSAFVAGDAYAVPQVTTVGFTTVENQFNSQVLGLATGGSNPSQMLDQLQTNAEALLQP
jgi:multiple sugar transport system substrate-binding protein